MKSEGRVGNVIIPARSDLKGKMNHHELTNRAKRWLLKTKGCGFVLSELVCNSIVGETPDAIGWKYGQSHLIECKTSRADFFSDKKKSFRRRQYLGMGNYRYYMTLPDLVNSNEIPHRWGLLYAYPTMIKVVKEPEFICYPTTAEREIPVLCSALRRVHLRGDLEKIYDRNTLKEQP